MTKVVSTISAPKKIVKNIFWKPFLSIFIFIPSQITLLYFLFSKIIPGNFVGATSSLATQYHQAQLHPQLPIPESQQQEQNRLSTGSIEKILSPFDEKEEWNKISKIIDSFGADIGSDIKKSTTPHNCKFLFHWLPNF